MYHFYPTLSFILIIVVRLFSFESPIKRGWEQLNLKFTEYNSQNIKTTKENHIAFCAGQDGLDSL